MTDGRGLLVAGDATDADRAAEQLRARRAEIRGAVAHLRQQRGGHREQLQKILIPLGAADIEQQSARRIGGVGGVTVPPVSRHSKKESTVPKASLPCPAAWLAPLTLSSSQEILVAEKYGSSSSPVLSVTSAS